MRKCNISCFKKSKHADKNIQKTTSQTSPCPKKHHKTFHNIFAQYIVQMHVQKVTFFTSHQIVHTQKVRKKNYSPEIHVDQQSVSKLKFTNKKSSENAPFPVKLDENLHRLLNRHRKYRRTKILFELKFSFSSFCLWFSTTHLCLIWLIRWPHAKKRNNYTKCLTLIWYDMFDTQKYYFWERILFVIMYYFLKKKMLLIQNKEPL